MNKIKMFGLLGVISLVLSACSHSTARQSDFLGEVSAEQLLAIALRLLHLSEPWLPLIPRKMIHRDLLKNMHLSTHLPLSC